MATPSLENTASALERTSQSLSSAIANHHWATAAEEARACMRLLGLLGQRLDTIAQLEQEGFWTAEVDRALQGRQLAP